MPNKNILSVTDATQKAYDYILREDYAKKTRQQYWYCRVVPIRRYCEHHGMDTYSSERLNECVFWLREQYEQGDLYYAK